MAHASELVLLLGPKEPAAEEAQFTNQWMDFYINFVVDLNPGGERIVLCYIGIFAHSDDLGNWTQYTPNSKSVLHLQRDNITMIADGVSVTPFLRLHTNN